MKNNKIFLHSPNLIGKEKKYLNECIENNYLTFGKHTDLFLKKIKDITKSKFLLLFKIAHQITFMFKDFDMCDEVIVPSITFIASINAIKYCEANPIFMDVDEYRK